MTTDSNRTIRIIGVPLDLGASRRGTDVGPSALRIAGLGAALRRMGYTGPQHNRAQQDALYLFLHVYSPFRKLIFFLFIPRIDFYLIHSENKFSVTDFA